MRMNKTEASFNRGDCEGASVLNYECVTKLLSVFKNNPTPVIINPAVVWFDKIVETPVTPKVPKSVSPAFLNISGVG